VLLGKDDLNDAIGVEELSFDLQRFAGRVDLSKQIAAACG
jgi:hypothetical protein